MSEEKTVTKGMVFLRKHAGKPVAIKVGDDEFYFRKLTQSVDEQVNSIITSHQDATLKSPKEPEEGATEKELETYYKQVDAYSEKSSKIFRNLTCELMRIMLVDEKSNRLFGDDDDIAGEMNNVLAQNFFTAFTNYRNGFTGGVVEAQSRFHK